MYEHIENDGNVIISESNSREFYSPQLQLMSIQKRYLCGYEICIIARWKWKYRYMERHTPDYYMTGYIIPL